LSVVILVSEDLVQGNPHHVALTSIIFSEVQRVSDQ